MKNVYYKSSVLIYNEAVLFCDIAVKLHMDGVRKLLKEFCGTDCKVSQEWKIDGNSFRGYAATMDEKYTNIFSS